MQACIKCGGLLDKGAYPDSLSHCSECNTYFNPDGTQINAIEKPANSKGNKIEGSKMYIIVYVSCLVVFVLYKMIAGESVIMSFTFFSALLLFIAFITIVIGFVSYPESVAIKLLFWFSIAAIAGSIVLYIITAVVSYAVMSLASCAIQYLTCGEVDSCN